MKAKVGRAEGARIHRDFPGRIDSLLVTESAGPLFPDFSERKEFLTEKFGESRRVAGRALQSLEAAVQILEERIDGKTGFGRGGEIRGSAARRDLFERPQKIQNLIDVRM